jgi:hypothetical protein
LVGPARRELSWQRETWRIMQALVDAPPVVHADAPGTWGPNEADALVRGRGRTTDQDDDSGRAESVGSWA